MIILYIATGAFLLVSLIKSRAKTLASLKVAYKRFTSILPAFGVMLVAVACILSIMPDDFIACSLGRYNIFVSVIIASMLGSITMMPGFITFPLCGILLKEGVTYMVISAFSTTLMMVGILTYPIEKRYFGVKITVIRNVLSFFIAITVAIITGIVFGELL
ncbi:MAG: hypothetical protein U5O15_02410 [Candidatus Krumholzibacteriota bacterium]|nr:hypothetical protein [Candidatus Krumholzibacteriota bacterium]